MPHNPKNNPIERLKEENDKEANLSSPCQSSLSGEKENKTEDDEVYPIEDINTLTSIATERQLRILLKHVVIGSKCFVKKLNPVMNESTSTNSEGLGYELRQAEILSIKNSIFEANLPKQCPKFYVHYMEFNKRLDEWIDFEKLDLTKPIEYLRGYSRPKGGLSTSHNSIEGPLADEQVKESGGKSNKPKTNQPDYAVIYGRDKLDGSYWDQPASSQTNPAALAKRKEIEKLRLSGSMTQNAHEISRVKNLNSIQIGRYEVETWYFSPYPPELSNLPLLYLCEFCFAPYGKIEQFKSHLGKCKLRCPPGNEIYRDGNLSFFEVDGRTQKKYSRHLALLSKLFLDHKTLYFDVDPFLFYILTQNDEYGCHIIGYFSKEKDSLEGYNLACILTLPQFQKKGFGRLLIQFSYELSKIEKKLGSPEVPLSDLGLLSYRAYWTEILVKELLYFKNNFPNQNLSIDQLANMTCFATKDVLSTLKFVGALRYYKSEYVIFLSDSLIELYQKAKNKKRLEVNPNKIRWKPFVSSLNQPKFLN